MSEATRDRISLLETRLQSIKSRGKWSSVPCAPSGVLVVSGASCSVRGWVDSCVTPPSPLLVLDLADLEHLEVTRLLGSHAAARWYTVQSVTKTRDATCSGPSEPLVDTGAHHTSTPAMHQVLMCDTISSNVDADLSPQVAEGSIYSAVDEVPAPVAVSTKENVSAHGNVPDGTSSRMSDRRTGMWESRQRNTILALHAQVQELQEELRTRVRLVDLLDGCRCGLASLSLSL